MPTFYTDGQRTVQDQFQTTKMADLLHQVIVHTEVQDAERAFIESRDMFFLATVDSQGQPTCSYKGGDPGFVKVVDGKTLAFPIYDGNGMFLSLGNIGTNAQVGLLFIDFETPHRLRVQGTASVDRTDPLLGHYSGADVVVRVAISAIFVNCSRYVHKYRRISASRYVPRPECGAHSRSGSASIWCRKPSRRATRGRRRKPAERSRLMNTRPNARPGRPDEAGYLSFSSGRPKKTFQIPLVERLEPDG